LPEDWHIKGSQWRSSIAERFATLLNFLEGRPERTIAVVSHHDFLRATLGESFAPGEVRAYPLIGGTLLGLRDRSGGSSAQMKRLLSGFSRSPGSRSPRESGSVGGNSSSSQRSSPQSTPKGGSPSASVGGSSNNLASYFKGATSLMVRVGSTPNLSRLTRGSFEQ